MFLFFFILGTFLLVYLNEYRTVVHAFVLQSSDRAKWIEMFDKAKVRLVLLNSLRRLRKRS